MKILILGSGTCVPSLRRNSPGYLLEAGDKQILVDCGSGTLLQLEKAGKSYRDIDAVFITHRHPDHFSDLMPLIHALVATPNFIRQKDLFIFGPKEFGDYYTLAFLPIFRRIINFSLHLKKIHAKMEFAPFMIKSTRTVHFGEGYAIRFEYNHKSVVFTGDTAYDKRIVEISKGADLLIADCSFPDHEKSRGHMSSKECGILAREAGVSKLLLSHLYPSSTPDSDRVLEAQKEFNGDIILAEDLMEIEV